MVLAIFGFVTILLSSVWLWIVYKPPSIGYMYENGGYLKTIYGVLMEGISFSSRQGKVHIDKYHFWNLSRWMVTFSFLNGLLHILGSCTRIKLFSYGFVVYMFVAVSL